MAIDPLKAGNGFKLVPTYYTNPWWPWRTTEIHDPNDPTAILTSPDGAAVLMAKWTGGLCVPMFWPAFNGLGSTDKNGDVSYNLKDNVLEQSSTFWTDENAHNYPFIKEYGQGSIFHSSSHQPHTLRDYGIRRDAYHMYPSSDPMLFKDNNPWNDKGAFTIAAPGSGKDHYTTYYWGGGSERATTKIKNVLGMYWLSAIQDSSYYSWINKVGFLYQNRQGEEIPLLPIGNNSVTGKTVLDYNRKPKDQDDAQWVPPGCSTTTESGRYASGVLRGAFLHPEQATYVIENQLELKGMWIEVYRNTSSGTGNPIGIFHSFFPWILSELTMFGRYYLHPFDLMASSSGAPSGGINSFRDHYYNKEEQESRDDYFKRYTQEVDLAGGWSKALIDPSGKYSKKIIVPPVMDFGRNPQNYTDDVMRLQATKEREYGGTKYLTSNGL